MDWEYTSNMSSHLDQTNNTDAVNNASNNSTNKDVTVPLDSFETMEQYLNYKNLINDEQEIDQKYFFVVVDTNVFLSNLEFIGKLIKINFKSEFCTRIF